MSSYKTSIFDFYNMHFDFRNTYLTECSTNTHCPAERPVCYDGKCVHYIGKKKANQMARVSNCSPDKNSILKNI